MGELARKSGCPELPASPLELLTPRPGQDYPVYYKMLFPIAGGGIGFVTACLRNLFSKRPLWAGIHYHFLLTSGCALFMSLARDWKLNAKAEVSEIYKHYVSLHPEDFPPYERKRYRDVYLPFEPSR